MTRAGRVGGVGAASRVPSVARTVAAACTDRRGTLLEAQVRSYVLAALRDGLGQTAAITAYASAALPALAQDPAAEDVVRDALRVLAQEGRVVWVVAAQRWELVGR